MRNSISFLLNGKLTVVTGKELFMPLSSFLRYQRGLTGTKVVCAEGDCGACTVMLARPGLPYESVNSCIAQTFGLDGTSVVTVEGLAQNEELSEVQNSMIRNFGGQCGFCTPGIVMAITALYEKKQKPTEQSAKNFLTGNLCRCTGYAPIIKAALDVDVNKHVKLSKRYPADLKRSSEAVLASFEHNEFFAPVKVQEAAAYKLKNPDVILFSGATDLGVQINKGHLHPRKLMSLHLIEDLYKTYVSEKDIFVGARVSLSQLQNLVKDKVPSLDQFLNIFASPQIKNAATLVGNLANASPIADMTPLLMSLDAEVEINSQKNIPLKDFYLAYKKIDLGADEIMTGIRFKIPAKNNTFGNYKVSQRRDLDISTVNASFNFEVVEGIIQKARISYGGVAATSIRLIKIEDFLAGKKINTLNINELKKQIADSIVPLSDVRGTSEYRKLLAANLFEKFANEKLGL